jgi:hypothetical protein
MALFAAGWTPEEIEVFERLAKSVDMRLKVDGGTDGRTGADLQRRA